MNKSIFNKEKKNWNENLSFYICDENSLFKKYLNKKTQSFYSIKKGKIIDIGCATGEFLGILPEKCEKYGTDFSQTFIKYAQKERPDIKFIKSSAQKLPFKDNYFDGIIFKGTLHHLKAQGILKSSLIEADRVLKKGGKIYIHDRCESVLGKLTHKVVINLRQNFKKIKHNQSTCASDYEADFGLQDLNYLLNIQKYQLIKQQYVLNLIFFLIVCFTNTVQYIIGFRIAQILRYVFYPIVLLSEQLFDLKNLTVEEFVILQKK